MSSHREIFRSSAIIGGSSALNIVIGVVRVKVLALLLGPAGIGLLGIYQNIMGVATTVAGCGLGDSGVRTLALSGGSEEVLTAVRRALLLTNLLLGLGGMLVVWFAREPIAQVVFEGAIQANDVGWLGLGVLFTLLATSRTTLLQGLRRIGDLARVNVISALATTTVGILFVYILGESGIVWFVIATPAMGMVVATYFTNRLPPPESNYDWLRVQQQCQSMIKFGMPVMVAALLNTGTQLLARSLILRELGIEATGHFEASWMISMTYLGFVLGAMATDYYPRLTAAIQSPENARRLVNEQGEMSLLLGGTVILAMITLAPLIMHLLYSAAFEVAGEVLRWQMLGSVIKLIGWPMGFVVLASGRSGLFVYTQFIWNAIFLLCLYLFLDQFGLLAVGLGFCFAYAVGALNIWFVVYKLIGLVPTRFIISSAAFLVTAGGTVIYLVDVSYVLSLYVGGFMTLVVAFFSFRKLNELIDITGWLRNRSI